MPRTRWGVPSEVAGRPFTLPSFASGARGSLRRGVFFEAWTEGEGWERYEVRAEQRRGLRVVARPKGL